MGDRKKHPSNPEKWLKHNAVELQRLGIPDFLTDDFQRFRYAVEEGEDRGRSGWNWTWLDNKNANQLCSLLEEVPGFKGGYFADDLQNKIRF